VQTKRVKEMCVACAHTEEILLMGLFGMKRSKAGWTYQSASCFSLKALSGLPCAVSSRDRKHKIKSLARTHTKLCPNTILLCSKLLISDHGTINNDKQMMINDGLEAGICTERCVWITTYTHKQKTEA
jgi:hypothetical protein